MYNICSNVDKKGLFCVLIVVCPFIMLEIKICFVNGDRLSRCTNVILHFILILYESWMKFIIYVVINININPEKVSSIYLEVPQVNRFVKN